MQEQVTETEEVRTAASRRRRGSLLVLLLLVLVSGITAALTYHIVSNDTVPPILPPDTLPEVEVRAVPEEKGTGEGGGEASDDGGGSVNLAFTDQVEISLADREARFYLFTPKTSNQSMVLDLLIQDTLILRSGGLPPGSRLESLPLLGNAVLQPGGYDGLIRLTFYDPVTGEKAAVNAKIPVRVTVREVFAETEAP